jgi:phosphoglucosamine mutase
VATPLIRFGTDGVRGRVGVDLTEEIAAALGWAVAESLPEPEVVVGRDTRASGDALARSFAAGVVAAGGRARSLGVAPTPAVAYRAAAAGAAGCSVTASHNPSHDNGLKFFDGRGLKLTDDQEAAIVAAANRVLPDIGTKAGPLPGPASVVEPGALDGYLAHLRSRVDGLDLSTLSVGIDCANGAACAVAPSLFRGLGLQRVVVLGDEADGTNINAGVGSTHVDHLAARVVAEGLDLGFSFDGDADRVMAVDGDGSVLDGDVLLALLADDLLARGQLTGRKVVVTHWSNLGLFRALERKGIEVVETDVGDRFVLDALTRDGLSLGGEQSGHLILRDLSTTGDGELTALEVLAVVARQGRPLGELGAAAMTKMPQVTVAVPVEDPNGAAAALAAAADDENARLGRSGRVVVRASGTEPVVRLMAEATTAEEAAAAVERLRAVVATLA